MLIAYGRLKIVTYYYYYHKTSIEVYHYTQYCGIFTVNTVDEILNTAHPYSVVGSVGG